MFVARRRRTKKKIPKPISARPRTPPATPPPIAAPETPLLLLLSFGVGSGRVVPVWRMGLEVLKVWDEEGAEVVPADVGEVDVVDVLVAVTASRSTLNWVAAGLFELREEKVSFIRSALISATGFAAVAQQMLI
jgi:hypothetical protein